MKKNEPQIIVCSDNNSISDSSDSYEFSVQKPDNQDLILVKYKSQCSNRNRLGSEDIALATGNCTGNDTRIPNNESKSGSQVFKADSPSKKLNSFMASGTQVQAQDLQPVKEEDKNESSNQDFSNEFDRSNYYPFGAEYRSSFKRSSYKMVTLKKQPIAQSEDIADDVLHEGPVSKNSIYNFKPNNNKEIFDRISRRSAF